MKNKVVLILSILLFNVFWVYFSFWNALNDEIHIEDTSIWWRIFFMNALWKNNYFRKWDYFIPTSNKDFREWNRYKIMMYIWNLENYHKNWCIDSRDWNDTVSELRLVNWFEVVPDYYQCLTKNNKNISNVVYVNNVYDRINKNNKSIIDALRWNLVWLRVLRRTIWVWNFPLITSKSPSLYMIKDDKLYKDWMYNYFLVVNWSDWKLYYVPLCWLFNNEKDWLCTNQDINYLNDLIYNTYLLNWWLSLNYFNKNRIT